MHDTGIYPSGNPQNHTPQRQQKNNQQSIFLLQVILDRDIIALCDEIYPFLQLN